MKEYIAIWHQEGGCDYSIGCGLAVHLFKAIDIDAAKTYVVEQLSDLELPDEVADSIKKVDIYETVDNGALVTAGVWAPTRKRKRAEHEQQLRNDKERSDYERLRKKFER